MRSRFAKTKAWTLAICAASRSRPTLVDRATHIFAMTGAHLETIHMFFPHGAEKTFLLREFEEAGTTVWRDVPDPIGMGRDVYEDCARTIKNALPSVLAFVEQSELAVPAWCDAKSRNIFLSYGEPSRPVQTASGSASYGGSSMEAACAKSIRKFSTRLRRKKNGSAKISS